MTVVWGATLVPVNSPVTANLGIRLLRAWRRYPVRRGSRPRPGRISPSVHSGAQGTGQNPLPRDAPKPSTLGGTAVWYWIDGLGPEESGDGLMPSKPVGGSEPEAKTSL
jgi:hypothetical protein